MALRLQAIINMVPAVDTVADIGCDHGKIAVSLITSGRAGRAICSDLSGKSLEKAKKLVSALGLGSKVTFRVGNGMEVLKDVKVDAAVVAGMGGELIAEILEKGKGTAPAKLVLSCNTKPEVLRLWLCENGYRIEDEDIVCERERFYPVILAGKGYRERLSDAELELGPVLLKKRHKTLKILVERKIAVLNKTKHKIVMEVSKDKDKLISDIEEKVKRYSEVLKCLYQ